MDKGVIAIFNGPENGFEVCDREVEAPGKGSVLLSLVASGLCGTDVHIAEGRLPVGTPCVIGHEFIGKVEALGEDVVTDGHGCKLMQGDTVVACIALSCGECLCCKAGETASCMNFNVTNAGDPSVSPYFHGGYGDYLHQPAHTLVKVPEGLDPFAVAAFPCAGPTAIRAFTYGGGLEAGELVVVQGLGPVGLFAVAWAVQHGCRVLAIGSSGSPDRMDMARKFGAQDVLDYRTEDPSSIASKVQTIASDEGRGDGADVVFEASGAPSAIPDGMELLRTRGRYLIPGQYSASGAISINPERITFRALRLIGSGQYTMADISTYLDFLQEHPSVAERFADCITGRFSVSAVNEAMQAARSGKGIKNVFIRP